MKIALVRPTIGARDHRPYRSRALMEPLALAILAGLTSPEDHIRFFDERLEPVPTDERFDLAAITVETFTARRAYQLAHAFRAAGTPVALGGFHATLAPEEAAAHADAVVLGEAEAVWPQVLTDVRAGCLRPRYQASAPPSLLVTRVDRSIFAGKSYLPMSLVQFSRGCRHACDFCSVRAFFGPSVTRRAVADVVQEIRQAGRKTVFFVDDNITGDPVAARQLFAALKPLKIRWISQAGIDVADDPGLLDAMAESGCLALVIGLESLSGPNLAQMNKAWAGSPQGYQAALAAVRRRGIMVYGAFVFGYDQDTPEVFDRTVDFALQQKLSIANFSMLQPFPGTPLYHRLEAQRRLLYPRWWLDPRYRWDLAAFRPARMSPQELAQGVRHARARFNSVASILRRAMDFQANVGDPFRAMVYLVANLISRQDIHRKQGLPLGYDEGLPASAPAGQD